MRFVSDITSTLPMTANPSRSTTLRPALTRLRNSPVSPGHDRTARHGRGGMSTGRGAQLWPIAPIRTGRAKVLR